MIRLARSRITGLLHASFATSKRSYYDILELQPNFTARQLRKHFLDRARKFHPDHNKSPDATQQFKLLKEAYDTLKDQQKRHMYDSGISETSDGVSPVHNQQAKTVRKYYENKWYGYRRPHDKDLRDDYDNQKAEYFAQKRPNPLKHVATFSMVLIAIFGYDILSNWQSEFDINSKQTQQVLQNSAGSEGKQNKKQAIMRRYLQIRAEANKSDF